MPTPGSLVVGFHDFEVTLRRSSNAHSFTIIYATMKLLVQKKNTLPASDEMKANNKMDYCFLETPLRLSLGGRLDHNDRITTTDNINSRNCCSEAFQLDLTCQTIAVS